MLNARKEDMERSWQAEKLSHGRQRNILHSCQNVASSALKNNLSTMKGALMSLSDLCREEKLQRETHHASFEQRIDYLEKCMVDFADKHRELENAHRMLHDAHSRTKTELEAAQKRIQDMESIAQRLDFVEQYIGDSIDKHNQQIEDAHKKLERHLTIEKRVDILEQLMDMVDKKVCASAGKELEEMEKASREQQEISKRLNAIARPLDMDSVSGSLTAMRMPSRQTPVRSRSTSAGSSRQAPLRSRSTSAGSSDYPSFGGFGGGDGLSSAQSPRLTPRAMPPRLDY
jgi:predicted DNA-binding protein YlxM (UPF0122 family)